MTLILIYILIGLMAVALLTVFVQLFRVKVWIETKSKRNPKLQKVGYMDYKGSQQVPEVHLIGKAQSPAIGRVKIGDDDDNAYVELLVTDGNDDSIRPQYRTYGFISQEGYIYEQKVRSKKPKKVGYTAKPSDPNTPSAVGERSWRSLWLKCTLNVYQGMPNEGGKAKEPIAVCYHKDFHSSKHDAMPPESRAAAFSYFFSKYNRHDYHEYYNSPAYGWKDTALLSAFVYAIIYVVWYVVNVKVLGNGFVGFRFWQCAPLYGMYFAIWAIIRAIKIECIENSNTIQPKIDLFNKTLGQRGFDSAILLCCTIILSFTDSYYQFDFVALALAISTGVSTNMMLRSSNSRWEIKNPFASDDEEDQTEDEAPNPEGDIDKSYNWVLDSASAKDVVGDITLHFSSQYIADLRYVNPFYCQRKDKSTRLMVLDMFHYMKEHGSTLARLRYIVSQIHRIADQKGLSVEDTLQFTLDFVQEPNIRYCMNRDSHSINQYDDYVRYPDEVLYDKEADSNSKALLAAMLFHVMEYNVLYLYSRVQQHGAVGIEVDDEWINGDTIFGRPLDDISFVHNGKRYLFCETTGDGFRIGGTMEGMRYEDFEEVVPLPLIENDVDDSTDDTLTRIYNWDLDSPLGHSLHGCYTLEMNKAEIDDLRSKNPFVNYFSNGSTYDGNIRTMFDYLNSDDSRREYVREIALYIKETVRNAKLPELDLVQFALDFCQEPNITYKVDEHSEGIKFAKEYMRYPDEVLFDKEGDCDCKSSITAALFHELGYNVIIMISSKLQHAAIGIEGTDEWINIINPTNTDQIVREHNGKKYLYCETTGDGFKIGNINDNYSIQDFEILVEINV